MYFLSDDYYVKLIKDIFSVKLNEKEKKIALKKSQDNCKLFEKHNVSVVNNNKLINFTSNINYENSISFSYL